MTIRSLYEYTNQLAFVQSFAIIPGSTAIFDVIQLFTTSLCVIQVTIQPTPCDTQLYNIPLWIHVHFILRNTTMQNRILTERYVLVICMVYYPTT